MGCARRPHPVPLTTGSSLLFPVLLLAALAGCGVQAVAVRDGAPQPVAEETRRPMTPFVRLDCGDQAASGLTLKLGPVIAAPDRTAEETLALKLDEMSGWGAPWSDLAELDWIERKVGGGSGPDRSAFVGSRPDGTEHAAIRLVRVAPGPTWAVNGYEVCARLPEGHDLPVFDGRIDCAENSLTEIARDYDPDNPDLPGTESTPERGLEDFVRRSGDSTLQAPDWTRHEVPDARGRPRSRNAVFVGTRDGAEVAALSFAKAGTRGYWSLETVQRCGRDSVTQP